MKEQEKQDHPPGRMPVAEAKEELRRRIRVDRRPFTPQESQVVCDHLQSLVRWRTPATILSFHPLPDEPDLLPLLHGWPDHVWVFPRIEGCHLTLHRWSPGVPWQPGPHGLSEPDLIQWPVVSPGEIDIILTPGMAFDRKGGRLGRGKGFYDRLLGAESFRGLKIGTGRLVAMVPTESHDIVMDLVVSPEGIHPTGGTAPSGLDIRGKSI